MMPTDNLTALRPTTPGMEDLAGGVAKVAQGSVDYPVRLMRADRPPLTVWYRGRLPRHHQKMIAIVGSRAATGAGCARTRALAAGLSGAGYAVVSGGAFGIDAAAHEGTIEAGGETWAVLGCGVDVVYPDRHGPLFDRIAACGGLLTEHPPETPPRRQQFPTRNRLVVALADAVVVVEAAYRSGALITASLARGKGLPVVAVPGSPGTDALLARGALGARDADEVLAALDGREVAGAPVPGAFEALVQALREGAVTAPTLADRLGRPLSEVMASLTEAEMDGWVRRVAGSHYEVGRGH